MDRGDKDYFVISQTVLNGYFSFRDFCLREITDVSKKICCVSNISNITQNINLIAVSIFRTKNGSLHSLHDALIVYPIHFL